MNHDAQLADTIEHLLTSTPWPIEHIASFDLDLCFACHRPADHTPRTDPADHYLFLAEATDGSTHDYELCQSCADHFADADIDFPF